MAHLTERRIEEENEVFAGTNGVSRCAASLGLRPAFRDPQSGRVEVACYANGEPAPFHLIDALPGDWFARLDAAGRPAMLRPEIECGFVQGERFYTRAEAAKLA